MIATAFMRVRRAELALHLPDQVGQFAARGNPVEQRCVQRIHRLPVDSGHVLDPELIALQTPHFAQHLLPLGARIDRQTNPIQVNPT